MIAQPAPPRPSRQKGKTLDQAGLQEALDSSPDVAKKGTGQFFTPKPYAKAFAQPLSPVRPVIFDPHCGSHNLTMAAATGHTKTLLGIDLDKRAQHKDVTTIIGDLNRIFPLMVQAECKFDLLMMNPPFGLRWPAPDVKFRHRRPARSVDGQLMIDSVQASWLMALDRLTTYGEGMMIAPKPVIEKLIEPCPTYKHVWAYVTLPQFFPGVRDSRPMAVLYFAKQHDNKGKPCKLDIPSPAPNVVTMKLRRLAVQRNIWLGKTERVDSKTRYLRDESTPERFAIVRKELLERNKKNRPQFNLWLDHRGRINTYLSAFDEVSRKISRELVKSLSNLRGKRPVELVLTRSERNALIWTIHEAGWKVDPSLIKAVENAVAEYHRSRVPFNKPTLAMRVAWAEEEDQLTAKDDWHSFRAGESYRLSSETFEGRKIEFRDSPEYGEEEVLVSGQELMICLYDKENRKHGFTQYALDRSTIQAEYHNNPNDETCRILSTVNQFHSIRDLMEHFEMPDVPDIAEVCPDLYEHYKRKLKTLEK